MTSRVEQKSEPSGSGAALVKPSGSGSTLGRNDIQVVGKHEQIVG